MFFFFPFFLAGFKYRHSVKSIRFPAMGLITGLILLISLFLILYVSPQETKWVLGSRSYALLGLHGWCAGILRLTQYAASFALALSLLLLATRKRTLFSTLGERSMYVFLTHPFVIGILLALGIYNRQAPTIASDLLLIIGGGAAALILSSPIICRLFKPLVQPNVKWLLKWA